MYIIPKQLREENKISDRFKIYWKDVKTCVVLLGTFLLMKSFVHSWFIIPYWISAAVFSYYLIQPSHGNPRKRNWEAILLFIGRDHTVYRSINHVQRQEENDADEGRTESNQGTGT